VDFNSLLHRHRLALMLQEESANAEEQRAYRQFARDYCVQIRMTRSEGGDPKAVCGFRK